MSAVPITPYARQSVIGLLHRLVSELTTLFRLEVQLAKSEIAHAMLKLAASATSIVAGGAILYAGVLFLLVAALLGLSQVVAPWLAALIVGGAAVIVGFVLILAGVKTADLSALKPRRSLESLRQDQAVLTRSKSS